MYNKIREASDYIQAKIKFKPDVGLVLGSGLGPYVSQIKNPIVIPFQDIPHFHQTSVEGHEGKLVAGEINCKKVIALQGRLHVYEGHDLEDVVLPVRALALLGIEYLIVTNASGGINADFHPGDLVLIEDHINLSGKNPLVGPNLKELGVRFPDMTEAYPKELRDIMLGVSKLHGIKMKSGVYCWFLGPTYETPAEIRYIRTVGADLVGMSTVPEVIAAHHAGVKVLGVACITNYAAGLRPEKLNHADVKDMAEKTMANFSRILSETIALLGQKA